MNKKHNPWATHRKKVNKSLHRNVRFTPAQMLALMNLSTEKHLPISHFIRQGAELIIKQHYPRWDGR